MPYPDTGQRLYLDLRRQIEQGTYPAGDALPSTRALAAELGVARGTVTAVYERLAAEGYVESRPGARTIVEAGLQPKPSVPGPPSTQTGRAPRLSAQGQRIAALPRQPGPRTDSLIADFRYGNLAPDDFPTLAWRRAWTSALLQKPARLTYGDPAGHPALRQALQAYLWRARGLRCTPEQIVVVNGSQQALDLCARLLLDPGDPVVIEDPGYVAARQVFIAVGGIPVPMPVDAEGLRTDLLASQGTARLAYVTPSHQFPLGGVLSMPRRQALLAWAADRNAYVIEDDYDGEFRYGTRPIDALQGLDRHGQVIYVGTVSKTLAPSLRLGYLVLPPALVSVFTAAKRLTDRHTPELAQQALATFIAQGGYERHVRRIRRFHARRRQVALNAIARHLPRVTVEGAAAGLHLVIWCHAVPRDQESALAEAARAAGVGIYGATALYADASQAPSHAGIVLGYASVKEAVIEAGLARLGEVMTAFDEV